MAKTKQHFEFNSFAKGINTEAALTNFPADFSRDEENFELDKNNTRKRRLGMDFEDGFTATATGVYQGPNHNSMVNYAVTSHVWEPIDSSFSYQVIQIGNTLYIFDASQSDALSSNLKGSVVLTNMQNRDPIQTDVWKDKLLIASNNDYLRVVSYDNILDEFSQETIDIKVRDIWGVDDGLEDDEQPSTLSDEHKYNLLNNGWTSDDIDSYHTSEGVYPSKSQQPFFAKTRDEDFDPEELERQYFGNTRAPMGHYIIDLYNRGSSRGTVGSMAGALLADATSRGMSTLVVFAGRAFYAGGDLKAQDEEPTSPSLANTVAFTQLLDGDSQLDKCYQEADPTSEYISDLISTDGGTITISEAGVIYKLVVINNTLLVFTTNGVWQIRNGIDGVGFRADSYQVVKVLNAPGVSGPECIISTETEIYYWADDGIYVMAQTDTGGFQAVNITDQTIRKMIVPIPSAVKYYIKGHYDKFNRKLLWLYSLDDNFDGYSYTNELVFNLYNKAFNKRSIKSLSEDTPFVSGYVNHKVNVTDVIVGQETVVKYICMKPLVTEDDDTPDHTVVEFTDTESITGSTLGAGNELFTAWNKDKIYRMGRYQGSSLPAALEILRYSISGLTELEPASPVQTTIQPFLGTEYPIPNMLPMGMIEGLGWLIWGFNAKNAGPLAISDPETLDGTKYFQWGTGPGNFSDATTPWITEAAVGASVSDDPGESVHFVLYQSNADDLYIFKVEQHGDAPIIDPLTPLPGSGFTPVAWLYYTNSFPNGGSSDIRRIFIGHAGIDSNNRRYRDFYITREPSTGTYTLYRHRLYWFAAYMSELSRSIGLETTVIDRTDWPSGEPLMGMRDMYDGTMLFSVNTNRLIKTDIDGNVIWTLNTSNLPSGNNDWDWEGNRTWGYSKINNNRLSYIDQGINLITIDTSTGTIIETVPDIDTAITNSNSVTNSDLGVVIFKNGNILKEVNVTKGTIYEATLTFSAYNNTAWKDWQTYDGIGVDADAYLITGPQSFQDNSRDKSILYLFTQFGRTETSIDGSGDLVNPGGCLAKVYWDYYDNLNNAKITQDHEIYRVGQYLYPKSPYTTNDFSRIPEVVITKSKLRGEGKSLSIKFSTEEDKDLNLMGWTIPMILNTDE